MEMNYQSDLETLDTREFKKELLSRIKENQTFDLKINQLRKVLEQIYSNSDVKNQG